MHSDLLHEFEGMTVEVDGLRERLEDETDKGKAMEVGDPMGDIAAYPGPDGINFAFWRHAQH